MTPEAALGELRRLAVSASLFAPTSLGQAVERLGFVQADPIRAPARAQDLTLRHRVAGYHAGDLERRARDLGIEEDFFINYGYVSRTVYLLMHPRTRLGRAPVPRTRREHALLAFLRERGPAHPRDVDAYFAHGRVTNYWGGTSRATTHLLDQMHYRGLASVVGRDRGVRIYAARDEWPQHTAPARDVHIDRLVDHLVAAYGPLPAASLGYMVGRLRYAVPQWRGALKAALSRAKARLAQARVVDVQWYWPADQTPQREGSGDVVRLLTPFDPVVWDRRRFEMLWGWPFRFEAYTPARRRQFGYYALPMLWRDDVVGWANLSAKHGDLHAEFGYRRSRPRERTFAPALDDEMDRMRVFLRAPAISPGLDEA